MLTTQLAAKMAACKRGINATLADLGTAAKIATTRHDDVARQIAEIDGQPPTEENQRLRAELYSLQSGLHAGIEFCHGTREQAGKTRPVQGPKDAAGQFSKTGTIGHQLAQALQ